MGWGGLLCPAISLCTFPCRCWSPGRLEAKCSLSLSLLTAVFSSGSGRGSLLDDKPMTALDLAASCHVPPETRRTLCSEASEVAVSLLLPCKDADGYADVFECLMPTVGE